ADPECEVHLGRSEAAPAVTHRAGRPGAGDDLYANGRGRTGIAVAAVTAGQQSRNGEPDEGRVTSHAPCALPSNTALTSAIGCSARRKETRDFLPPFHDLAGNRRFRSSPYIPREGRTSCLRMESLT